MPLQSFLSAHLLTPDAVDYADMTARFVAAMSDGLAGRPGSVRMLPTYCYADGHPALHTPVAVIDAGGTNFRSVLVTLTEDGCRLEHLREQAMPGTHGPVEWSHFIGFCADALEPLLMHTNRVGLCFSYPAAPQPNRDSRVLQLTKQVQLLGAIDRPVCADLNEELKKRGHRGLKFCLINDTLAVQYGVAAHHHIPVSETMGLVCGTGANTCCALPTDRITKLSMQGSRPMLVNCESGAFDGVGGGTFDHLLHAQSVDPGQYAHEKMVSGGYQGTLCLLALQGAAAEGLFSPAAEALLDGLSALESRDADNMSGPLAALQGADRDTADAIIQAIFDRGAKITCCCLTAIMELTDAGKTTPFSIGAEGSLFLKSRRFRDCLDRHMDAYTTGVLGRQYRFLTCPHTTFIGTAAAALL